jgi:hypothetical protein
MKIVLIQFQRQDNFSYYFLSEHMRLFYHSLVDLGHDVVVDKCLQADRVNILFSVMQALNLNGNVAWEKFDYVVYQPEVLSEDGVNNLSSFLGRSKSREILKEYLKILAQARMVWDLFPFNVDFLARYRIQSNLLTLGHHPCMDSFDLASEVKPEYDAVFFGSLSKSRDDTLLGIEQRGIKVKVISHKFNLIRDHALRRSKINLALPLDSQVMNHISPFRVYAGLNHGCMTVSTKCRTTPSVEGLLEYVEEEQLFDRLETILESGEYLDNYRLHRRTFVSRPMNKIMSLALKALDTAIKQDSYTSRR